MVRQIWSELLVELGIDGVHRLGPVHRDLEDAVGQALEQQVFVIGVFHHGIDPSPQRASAGRQGSGCCAPKTMRRAGNQPLVLGAGGGDGSAELFGLRRLMLVHDVVPAVEVSPRCRRAGKHVDHHEGWPLSAVAADRHERRRAAGAALLDERAAGREGTAGGQIDGAGDLTTEAQALTRGLGVGEQHG